MAGVQRRANARRALWPAFVILRAMVSRDRAAACLLVAIAALELVVLAPGCGKKREGGSPEVASSASAPGATSGSPAASAMPAAPAASFTPRTIAKLDWHGHIDPEIALPARRFLEAHGIGRVVNLSGGWVGEGLEDTIAMATATSGYYIIFANIDFQGIGTAKWAAREVAKLERAKAMGARGVKIAKNLGLGVKFPDGKRVPVDDPALDPVFDAMARLKMPLAIHTGDPKAFFDPMGPGNERMDELASHPAWSFADRTRFPTWEGLYDEFERRVKKSKGTTIVGVHFGNAPEEPERVRRMLDTYPNFYVDTAARIPEIGRKAAEVRRTILEHPDRVVFGTDIQVGGGMLVLGAGEPYGHTKKDVEHFFMSSWEFFETAHKGFAHPTPIQGNWTIDGIDLPPDVLEKVYHANAERLLGLPPTPIVMAAPGASGEQ
jgi:predicted TIM-barrel fold metal-dependent hydrolase